ncbi:hypothetical protein DM860_005081 [Cuscuta australis]|uniref:Uncharacterized protein n=1 Tax=Cuscuta australis TaxID=267555 RepID=A0A328DMC7_9ASTE|nr:hypothetical protein DM860_005081 [Cuscuta australis]
MEEENQESPPAPVQKENAGKPSLTGKTTIPDRLKLPKAFKYPERYTSPTDQIMSPVSKRLLCNAGRTRKAAAVAAADAGPSLPPKPIKMQALAPLQPDRLES